jgi:outer membrane protein TolC
MRPRVRRGAGRLVTALLSAAMFAAAAGAPARAAKAEPAAGPTDTLRLTLEQALERALGSGNEMRLAQAGIGVAEGRVKEVLAQALPQVTGTVSYNRKLDSIFKGVAETDTSGLGDIFANSPFGAVHGWTLDLTASQLLWSGGRVGAGIAAARAVRRSVSSDRDQVAADVSLAVQQAYWDALYRRELAAIAQNALGLAREHLRQVELYRRQGSRSEYDLLQAQVDAANQEPVVVASRSAAELAMLDLKRALNLPLGQPLSLESALAFEGGRLPVPAETPSDAAARPALLSAEAMVQARIAALRVETSGRWPQLVAQATLTHQAFPADGTPTREQFLRSVDANLKLEWPLFQGFRTFGGVQRASNELRQAVAQRDALKQAAELELAQARLGVDEALATLAARRGTARLAGRAHHLAEVRWRNGLGTQLEVSDARLRMQDAQVNEVLAFKEYRLSLARLERAAGRAVATTARMLDELSFDPQARPSREESQP